MKYYYKINEISKLYGISADSLRYYEDLGILHPARSENGYRLYSISELWQLNVIKDLRKLNLPFSKIKEYFNHRNLKSTTELLTEQSQTIDEQIKLLMDQKEYAAKLLENINTYMSKSVDNDIYLQYIPQRKCLHVPNMHIATEAIDMNFRILQSKTQDRINLVGNTNLCVFMSIDKILEQDIDFYQSTFCLLDNKERSLDFYLNEGHYLCITYQGPHWQSMHYTRKLLDYAQTNLMKILGSPIEICILDIHETSNPDEYVTQIQLPVDNSRL